jgi:hypothetical protein
MNEDIRKSVRAWAKTIGEQAAMGRLVGRGMNPRTAELLCFGEYGSKPKAYRNMLIEEMSKDGFTVGAVRSA